MGNTLSMFHLGIFHDIHLLLHSDAKMRCSKECIWENFTKFVKNIPTMKRLFVFLAAILTFVVATAQVEHSIILDQSSFRKVNTDALTGVNVDPIRKDSSRNTCARIKIQFANMSRAEVDALVLQFRSNTDLVRQEIGYYDNILILEMTAKPVTRFYVQSPEYGQSNEVMLNLEGDCEYEMQARLNQSFSIIVDSNAAGADIYIDGIKKAKTDANYRATIKEVMIGEHTLKLAYNGISAEQKIVVNGDNISFHISVNTAALKPQYVVFNVEPTNTVVTIDGQLYTAEDGVVVAYIEGGNHTFKAEARGYHPQSGNFTVAGAKIERTITLKGDYANVTIKADSGADIYVNDKKMGTTTWSGRLNSGLYLFEARKSGYRTQSLTQQISSDNPQQSYTLPALIPIYGSADITSSPAMADITIDGKSVGRTPLQLDNLLVGTHTVKISKSGYNDKTQTITISEDKTTTITATLTKQQISAPTSGTYKIGDLVTVDGVQGIVFQIRPVVKIVSVKETKAKWADSENTTGATDMEDGRVNMEKIKSIPDWQTKFPAFKWCADYGSGWYLPAFKELKTLHSQRYSVNSTLSANNMARLTVNDFGWLYMWSSTERGDSGAYPGFCSENGPAYNKKCSFAVRAVYVLE